MTQGPPPGVDVPPDSAPTVATRSRTFGVASVVLTLLGAVAALVGLFAVRWTTVDGGTIDRNATFLTLRRFLVRIDDSNLANKPSWLIAYFVWAGFVLLGLTLVLALLASVPGPTTSAAQALGIVVALVSAAGALLAPQLDGGNGLSEYLRGGVGMYFVAGGSILMGLGAALGPRKTPRPVFAAPG